MYLQFYWLGTTGYKILFGDGMKSGHICTLLKVGKLDNLRLAWQQ